MECARNICAESRGEIAACSRRPLGSLIKGCFRELEIWLGMQKHTQRPKKKKRERERQGERERKIMLIDLRTYCRENKGFLIFFSFIALILHLFSVGLSLIEVIWKNVALNAV